MIEIRNQGDVEAALQRAEKSGGAAGGAAVRPSRRRTIFYSFYTPKFGRLEVEGDRKIATEIPQPMSTTMTDHERTLPGGGIVHDRRDTDERSRTIGFIVATDSFLSGWGKAPGRSYFAIPFDATADPYIILHNMQDRSEMKRARIVGADWRPKISQGDHLSIQGLVSVQNPKESHWLTPGWFRRQPA